MSATFGPEGPYEKTTLDLELGTVRLEFTDGRVIEEAMTASAFGPLVRADAATRHYLKSMTIDWSTLEITHRTERGDDVTALLFDPSNPEVPSDTPSVYLDQNHWSKVAGALVLPERVANAGERKAAQEIAELALARKILVPLSSAHLRETSALYGDRRYEVGVAMANIARGWQLRHPSAIWRDEMLTAVAVHFNRPVPDAAKRPAITLEPHAIFDDDVTASHLAPYSPELLVQVMSWTSATVGLLIDPVSASAPPPSTAAPIHCASIQPGQRSRQETRRDRNDARRQQRTIHTGTRSTWDLRG